MKKLIIDTGVEEFEINGGKVLRFNPADINIYNRLMGAREKIVDIEKRLVEKGSAIGEEEIGETVIAMLAEADKEMKALLQDVFGAENDFEDIFFGVNLLSVAKNGERVITNFIVAITPVLEEGAKRTAKEQAAENAAQIKTNRAQRRAQR